MKRSVGSFVAACVSLLAMATVAQAHCQVPCGIYNDEARFTLLREHVATIEKSMTEITRLSKEQPVNWNQIVRWVINKDNHADQLSEIITYYFLAQRIKAPQSGDREAQARYLKQLALVHAIVVNAMKAKQTTDLQYCENLKKLIDEFEAVYYGKEKQQSNGGKHAHSHPHEH